MWQAGPVPFWMCAVTTRAWDGVVGTLTNMLDPAHVEAEETFVHSVGLAEYEIGWLSCQHSAAP